MLSGSECCTIYRNEYVCHLKWTTEYENLSNLWLWLIYVIYPRICLSPSTHFTKKKKWFVHRVAIDVPYDNFKKIPNNIHWTPCHKVDAEKFKCISLKLYVIQLNITVRFLFDPITLSYSLILLTLTPLKAFESNITNVFEWYVPYERMRAVFRIHSDKPIK